MADYIDLRHNGAYEDKTAELAAMIKDGEATDGLMLAKPNGYGKSTSLSVLKYLFAANREDFRHMAIETLDYDWKERPVVFLNMARVVADSEEEFNRALHNVVVDGLGTAVLGQLGTAEADAEALFSKGLALLCAQRKDAVVLVDNTDAPVRYVKNAAAPAYDLIPALNRFYGLIKAQASDVGFMLMTSDMPFADLQAAGIGNLNFLKEVSGTLSAFRG